MSNLDPFDGIPKNIMENENEKVRQYGQTAANSIHHWLDMTAINARELSFANYETLGIAPYEKSDITYGLEDLNYVSLSGARLTNVSFEGTQLNGADFSGALLVNVKFLDCEMNNVSLCGADLIGCTIDSSTASGIDLHNSSIWDTMFGGYFVHLKGDEAIFNNVDFTKAGFLNCSFDGATFSVAELHKMMQKKNAKDRTEFIKRNIEKNKKRFVSRTKKGGAILSSGEFLQCKFRNAFLSKADLSNTILSGSDFHGAYLKRAQITGAVLDDVDFRDSVINGLNYEEGIPVLPFFIKAPKFLNWIAVAKDFDRTKQSKRFLGIQVNGARGNPFFVRYASDQAFIEASQEKHPKWSFLWKHTTNYGQSITLLAFWGLIVALLFGFIYQSMPIEWIKYSSCSLDVGSCSWPWLTPYYFSIVTFTTLGFGDVTPTCSFAQFIVILEVILGYVMLGLLVSIFANIVARRS